MSDQHLLLESNRTTVFHCDVHTSNICNKIQTFYKQKEFFDVVLKAGIDGVEVQAHRIVIFASSDYLSNNKHKLSTAKTLRVGGIKGTALESIVNFMYTASIELCSETVESILRAAGIFKMNTLIAACCDFLCGELDPCNCLGIALLAEQYNNTALYKKATTFAYRNFEKVCTEREFLKLSEEQFNRFLSSDDLTKASQEKVFLSLLAWTEHDKALRENSLHRLLSHIQFSLLDPLFIIKNKNLVCKTTECQKLILSWMEWHLSPESQSSAGSSETNSKLYFTSGYSINDIDVLSFDSSSNVWSLEGWPQTVQNMYGFRLNFVNETLIVAAGGEYHNRATNRVQCLNLETKKWSEMSPMSSARFNPCLTELNGDLYVVGGSCNGNFLHSVEKYDFSTSQWQLVAPLSERFTNVKVVALDGLLYAIGEIYTEKYTSLLECYDPKTNKWTQKAFKNEKSLNFGIAAVNGYLYAVGGSYKLSSSRNVEQYNPLKDSWNFVRLLPQALTNVLCASLNNRLIACGCDNIVLEYDPIRDTWTHLASLPVHYQRNYNLFSN